MEGPPTFDSDILHRLLAGKMKNNVRYLPCLDYSDVSDDPSCLVILPNPSLVVFASIHLVSLEACVQVSCFEWQYVSTAVSCTGNSLEESERKRVVVVVVVDVEAQFNGEAMRDDSSVIR